MGPAALIIPAIMFILGAPGIINGMAGMFPPFPALMTRKGFKDRPDLIPTTDEIVHLRIRRLIDDRQYFDMMAQAGLAQDRAEQILSSAQTYLSALDYITLWRREEMSDAELDEQLTIIGIKEDQIAKIKSVTLYMPTPQDIVRFAVRESYTPSAIDKYGLDEDIPQEYLDAGRKAGLSEEAARLYWYSHWDLPSPTQVYEMLHRRLINSEDVTQYLKAADYMPYWRDKLQAISYNPLTRVDIRRMYAQNIIGYGEVKNAYMDLGYTEHNAELLAQFTAKIAETDEKVTPKGDIMSAYRAGIKDRADASLELGRLGYSSTDINDILDTEDAKIRQELIDLEADGIIDQFNNGQLTMEQLQAQLTTLGVTARMMQLTIQRELAQARKRAKNATKADFDTWYKLGLMTGQKYGERMKAIGYNNADISMYLKENEIEYIHTSMKKYPYTGPLRRYLMGNINGDQLYSELVEMKYDIEAIDAIVEIARTANT